MNFVINTDELKDLTLDEALCLLALHQKVAIGSHTVEGLVKKGYLFKYDSGHIPRYTITTEGIEAIESLVLNSEFKGNSSEEGRYERLAKKLRELFPEGRKDGTNYYWRDSVSTISRKLKALVKKYGECFTDEQAIEATKRYVSSFNGDYRYMQLLKYFISKQKVIDGSTEENSQLLSYIENSNQDNEDKGDWTSTII